MLAQQQHHRPCQPRGTRARTCDGLHIHPRHVAPIVAVHALQRRRLRIRSHKQACMHELSSWARLGATHCRRHACARACGLGPLTSRSSAPQNMGIDTKMGGPVPLDGPAKPTACGVVMFMRPCSSTLWQALGASCAGSCDRGGGSERSAARRRQAAAQGAHATDGSGLG